MKKKSNQVILVRSSIKVGILGIVIDRGNRVEKVSGEREVPGDEVESGNQSLGMVDMVMVVELGLLLALAMALELSHNNGAGEQEKNGPFINLFLTAILKKNKIEEIFICAMVL